METKLQKVSPEMNLPEHSQNLKPPEINERVQKELKYKIEETKAKFLRECNIPSLFQTKTFKNFDRKLQPKAYDLVNQWSNCQVNKKKKDIYSGDCFESCGSEQAESCTHFGMLILSPKVYGVGKTHLITAFLNRQMSGDDDFAYISHTGHIVARSCPVYFISEVHLLARIRATYSDRALENEEDIYNNLKNYDYLAIDDVGKTKPRDYSFLQSVYFRIVDDAYTQEYNHLIMTTNLDFKELEEHLGGATADRLVEMCGPNIVKMSGQSYRSKLNK